MFNDSKVSWYSKSIVSRLNIEKRFPIGCSSADLQCSWLTGVVAHRFVRLGFQSKSDYLVTRFITWIFFSPTGSADAPLRTFSQGFQVSCANCLMTLVPFQSSQTKELSSLWVLAFNSAFCSVEQLEVLVLSPPPPMSYLLVWRLHPPPPQWYPFIHLGREISIGCATKKVWFAQCRVKDGCSSWYAVTQGMIFVQQSI